MSITQNNRFFSFDSPLGPDVLLVNSFAGTEKMSELFEFHLELVSEDFSIDYDTIIDRNVTVGIRMSDDVTFRYFNGYINHFEPIRHEGRLAYYNAIMVPWLWYLTQTSDNLIYQNKTVVEVITATFDKSGFKDYDVKSLGDRHVPWIQCCQYQENSFEFISRLAEAEGIYYFFKHEQGKHTLVMVDHMSNHQPCPYQATIKYEHQTGPGAYHEDDYIISSNMRKVIRPNKFAHKDFNFLIPSHELYYEAPMKQFMGSSRTLEQYVYPGDYEWQGDAPDWGDLRQEEFEHDRTWVGGSGNARALIPGYRFDLTGHDRAEQNINYLVVSVTHRAHEGAWGGGMDQGTADYNNSYTAIPSSVQFRPGRKTDTPNIASLQTAVVVGPPGEEIYTDEYGRVKVHFHWDRTKPNADSSCWVRVMQPIAGPGFGHVWLPRVGQEVIVQFVDGDPDRPVVTGCLYNHNNHPPYPLPGNKNWSGIKTRSTLNGDDTEFNELRFVDAKGDELFVVHAQKDLQISVENDAVKAIGRDFTLQITRNKIEEVDGDKNITVKGSLNEDIQDQKSLNVKNDINEKAGGNIMIQAGGDLHFKAGGRIVFEAANGVTWFGDGAGGANFIDINNSGVIIQGTEVQINCGVAPPPGAQDANPTPPQTPNLAAADTSSATTTPNLVTGAGPAPAGASTDDNSGDSGGSSNSSSGGSSDNGGSSGSGGVSSGGSAGGTYSGGAPSDSNSVGGSTGSAAGSAASDFQSYQQFTQTSPDPSGAQSGGASGGSGYSQASSPPPPSQASDVESFFNSGAQSGGASGGSGFSQASSPPPPSQASGLESSFDPGSQSGGGPGGLPGVSGGLSDSSGQPGQSDDGMGQVAEQIGNRTSQNTATGGDSGKLSTEELQTAVGQPGGQPSVDNSGSQNPAQTSGAADLHANPWVVQPGAQTSSSYRPSGSTPDDFFDEEDEGG